MPYLVVLNDFLSGKGRGEGDCETDQTSLNWISQRNLLRSGSGSFACAKISSADATLGHSMSGCSMRRNRLPLNQFGPSHDAIPPSSTQSRPVEYNRKLSALSLRYRSGLPSMKSAGIGDAESSSLSEPGYAC